MPYGFLIGLGSGLVSALLFYSAARGSPLLGTLLLLLTPLPSLLAGLGWGWLPAGVGGPRRAVLVVAIVGGPFAVGYFLALGLPSALAAYLAYLSRPHPDDPDAREWYPAGRLLAAMALYAGALPVLLLPLIGGSYEALRPVMARFCSSSAKRWLPPGEHTDRSGAGRADGLGTVPPASRPRRLLAHGLRAQPLSRRPHRPRLGRLGRDWPDLPALAYPPAFACSWPLALVASIATGIFGVVRHELHRRVPRRLPDGRPGAHALRRPASARMWLLWLVYLGLFFLWPFFMPSGCPRRPARIHLQAEAAASAAPPPST